MVAHEQTRNREALLKSGILPDAVSRRRENADTEVPSGGIGYTLQQLNDKLRAVCRAGPLYSTLSMASRLSSATGAGDGVACPSFVHGGFAENALFMTRAASKQLK